MNIFYLLFLTIVFNLLSTYFTLEISDSIKRRGKQIHDLCLKETEVNEELIKQTIQGIIPNDRLLKCYFHCVLDKVGLIDENNVVHIEYLIDLLPKEMQHIVQNLMLKCKSIGNEDKCEASFESVNCYFKTDPESLRNKFKFIFE